MTFPLCIYSLICEKTICWFTQNLIISLHIFPWKIRDFTCKNLNYRHPFHSTTFEVYKIEFYSWNSKNLLVIHILLLQMRKLRPSDLRKDAYLYKMQSEIQFKWSHHRFNALAFTLYHCHVPNSSILNLTSYKVRTSSYLGEANKNSSCYQKRLTVFIWYNYPVWFKCFGTCCLPP